MIRQMSISLQDRALRGIINEVIGEETLSSANRDCQCFRERSSAAENLMPGDSKSSSSASGINITNVRLQSEMQHATENKHDFLLMDEDNRKFVQNSLNARIPKRKNTEISCVDADLHESDNMDPEIKKDIMDPEDAPFIMDEDHSKFPKQEVPKFKGESDPDNTRS